ncbi:MAG: ABC transporter permease [Bryobacteraceae bacterium]|nr:ABC transporter permease [Bryobacteraceae bacterium]
MSRWEITGQIALWEFRRWFKLKDFLISMFVSGLFALLGFLAMRYLLDSEGSPVKLAYVGPTTNQPKMPGTSRIRIEPAGSRTWTQLETAVANKDLDGVLTFKPDGRVELFAAKRPGWQGELEEVLQAEHSRRQIAASGLPPERLAAILAPLGVDTRWGDRGASKIKLMVAALMTLFMLLGIFTGSAYLFTGITGEKQIRVTEQVVAAVSPQTWIDGKILGTALFSLVSMAAYVVSIIVSGPVWNFFAGQWVRLPWSWDVVPLGTLALYFVFAVLGMMLWFAVMAGVCATINDPNTSGRSTMLFLPMLCSVFGFFVLKDPDLAWLKVLGLVPFTSAAVLPARLAAGEVAHWEVAAAIALLLITIWVLRLMAGRVFSMAILMQGKEPSWAEMWRAARS